MTATVSDEYGPHREQRYYRNTWAIIVGIDKYSPEQTGFMPLRNAANDARALRERLRDEFGFKDDNVDDDTDDSILLLLDERATKNNILAAFQDWLPSKGVQPEDAVLFFLSGHGDNDAGSGFIVPIDGQRGKLRTTGISLDSLREIVAGCPCRHKVVILDCCASGGLFLIDGLGVSRESEQDLPHIPGGRPLNGTHGTKARGGGHVAIPPGEDLFVSKNLRGHAVLGIAATRRFDAADDAGKGLHSLFTSHLLQALDERADSERLDDRMFTFRRLCARVCERVASAPGSYQLPVWGPLEQGDSDFLFKPTVNRRTPTELQSVERYSRIIEQARESFGREDHDKAKRLLISVTADPLLSRLRSFEWYHLFSSVRAAGSRRLKVGASKLAIAPSGEQFAVFEAVSQRISVWSVANSRQLYSLAADGSRLIHLAFSPQGDSLAATFADGTVSVWNTRNRERAYRGQLVPEEPADVAWSQDGVIFGAVSNTQCNTLEVRSGRIHAIERHSSTRAPYAGCAFSSDRRQLFVLLADATIIACDPLKDSEPTPVAKVNIATDDRVLGVFWCKSTGQLALVTMKECLTLDPKTGRVTWRQGHVPGFKGRDWDRQFERVAFAPGAEAVIYSIVVDDEQSLVVQPVSSTSKNPNYVPVIESVVGDIATDAASNVVGAACLDGTVRLVGRTADPDAVRVPLKCPDPPLLFSLSKDGSTLAGCCTEGISVWDGSTGRLTKYIRTGSHARVAIGLPSVTSHGNLVAVPQWNHVAVVEKCGEPKTVRRLGQSTLDNCLLVRFSPDDQFLLAAAGKILQLWRCDGWESVGHTSCGSFISSIAFSPDGRFIVTGDVDGKLVTWKTRTLSRVQTLDCGRFVTSIDFDATGTAMATSDLDLKQFDELATIIRAEGKTPTPLLMSSFASRELSPRLTLWQVPSGKILWQVSPRDVNYSVGSAFTPDGLRIVTSGASGWRPVALFFDALSGKFITALDLRIHRGLTLGMAGGAAFDVSGSLLATWTLDGCLSSPGDFHIGPVLWRARDVENSSVSSAGDLPDEPNPLLQHQIGSGVF